MHQLLLCAALFIDALLLEMLEGQMVSIGLSLTILSIMPIGPLSSMRLTDAM